MRLVQKYFKAEVVSFVILTIISAVILFRYVDLKPQVDDEFFFSSSDPQFQNEKAISNLFERKDAQLIMSAEGDIFSKEYTRNIDTLSRRLKSIDGIAGIKSITEGPANLEEAINSPLWRRILISENHDSTNIIVIIDQSNAKQIIKDIELIIENLSAEDFQLRMSGLPYVVELIRRYLIRDIKVFTLLSIIIFSIVIALIFRSFPILIGTLTACTGACIWTLMIIRLLDIRIGLLTANLGTIIFVLTLSHIIFLTYNWQHLIPKYRGAHSVDKAVSLTFEASFWSMLTTFLGFASLLSVPAKPLRELGFAGSIGSVVAIIVSYSVYPAFLRLVKLSNLAKDHINPLEVKIYSFLDRKKYAPIIIILALLIISAFGIRQINNDPSLISYFSESSDITKGLKYIDESGGSSPLLLSVKMASGEKLGTRNAYQKLWDLQRNLEINPAIGTIISLPVLMSEAKRTPFAAFFTWNWLFDIMEKPEYDHIAKSFISPDRSYGLFLLRMNELGRVKSRLVVIDEIKEVVASKGFTVGPIGGIYSLQGHLAKLVTSSLITGLAKLLILFALISLLVSHSLKTACAMTVTICIVPICILGAFGLFGVPLDIISAPASNIAIAMGIDAMIHMVKARRHMNRNRKEKIKNWYRVRVRLRHPILTSMCIICAGFSIFSFSSFPPTQRFGLSIMLGAVVAAFTALYVMPFFITNLRRITHS